MSGSWTNKFVFFIISTTTLAVLKVLDHLFLIYKWKIDWQVYGLFLLPLALGLLYWMFKIKLLKIIHQTHFFTSFDMWIIGILSGGLINFFLFRKYNAKVGLVLIFLLLVNLVWIKIRKSKIHKVPDVFEECAFYSDEPTSKDELERMHIAEKFVESLSRITAKSYVMSITGGWGEGKTSMKNFICAKLDRRSFIVCDFDPWNSNSMESLIKNFFISLNAAINEDIFLPDLSLTLLKYREIISIGLPGTGINLTNFVNPNSRFGERVKEKLRGKLDKIDRKILFFIDNIDRLTKEEIILTFKLVKLFGDLPNIYYILLFDKKYIEIVLGDEIKVVDSFLEKIIGFELALPKIKREIIENMWRNMLSITKSHTGFNLGDEDLDRYMLAMEYLSPLVENVRKAKLHVNRISLKSQLISDSNLKYLDFFIIESIAFFFPKQYTEIYYNKDYFVNNSERADNGLEISVERRRFFDSFFAGTENMEEINILKNLLSMIFDSVYNYQVGFQELSGGRTGKVTLEDGRTRIAQLLDEFSITHEDYFDKYFTFV